MRPIENAGGHTGLTMRRYPIAPDTVLYSGQVVKLSAGLTVSADAAETGPILGIAGESHPGTNDALNSRADGPDILVYDNPSLIFECPAPVFAAASGSATTVVPASGAVDSTAADDAFNGSVLVLVKKADGSANTDPIGMRIPVTDYAKSGTVITKASGGVPSEGDEYEVYPMLGAAVGGIAALDGDTRSMLTLSAAGAAALKCVGHDYDRHRIRLMCVEHIIAQTPAGI